MTNSDPVLMNGLLRHWVNKIRSRKPRILTRQMPCADQVHQPARSKCLSRIRDVGSCHYCTLQSARRTVLRRGGRAEGRFMVAAYSIPSVFRTSRPRQNPMHASRSLQTLFRPSSILLVPGRIRCTLRGRCRLCSVRLPYFSSTAESDVRSAVAADSIPSVFRTPRPRQNSMYAPRSLQTLFRPSSVLLVPGISHVPRVQQLSCGPHSRRFSVWAQRKPTPRIRERHF